MRINLPPHPGPARYANKARLDHMPWQKPESPFAGKTRHRRSRTKQRQQSLRHRPISEKGPGTRSAHLLPPIWFARHISAVLVVTCLAIAAGLTRTWVQDGWDLQFAAALAVPAAMPFAYTLCAGGLALVETEPRAKQSSRVLLFALIVGTWTALIQFLP